MRGKLLVIGAALFVAGCEAVEGPTSDGITADFKNESAKAFVAGYQPAEIKTVKGSDDVSANCKIASSKYQATFTTPAKVNLPAYSQGAVNATLTCTYDDVTKSAVFAPVNLSKKARTETSIGVFLLCPICGIGVAAANASGSAKETDIFGHVSMKIEF